MKRTGIKDVAKAAGVSITTVSRALNGYGDVSVKTRTAIEEIARQLNYAPDVNARSLGGMTDTTIALLVSDLQPKDESGLAFGIISGLYQACARYHCEFILLATNTAGQGKVTYLQLCRKKNIDGVVVMGLRTDDPYYHEVLDSQIPCVLIDLDGNAPHTSSLSIDNEKAAEEAVGYLIQQGHVKIGMMNGEALAAVSKDRFAGYKNALLKEGIPLNPEYVVCGDFREQKALEEGIRLLSAHPEITAVFCASDLMAMGVIEGAKTLSRKVPEDLSVIGFDDIPIAAHVHGGITTVRQNPYEMGLLAGKTVWEMLENRTEAGHFYVPYELVIRGTTAPVRGEWKKVNRKKADCGK